MRFERPTRDTVGWLGPALKLVTAAVAAMSVALIGWGASVLVLRDGAPFGTQLILIGTVMGLTALNCLRVILVHRRRLARAEK